MSVLGILPRIWRHPLNRGRPVRATLRFIQWQLSARLAPGEVLFHWIDDCLVVAAPGEQGFTGNIYCGLVELPEMAYVLHVTGSDDLFVDVGANVGAYTLLACAVGGAAGCCFEPVPSTYGRLLRNLRVNDLLDRVEPRNQGVGESPGQLRLTTTANCENHVVGDWEDGGDAITVDVTTLDDALRGRRATFLKIDVEGFETAVIAGGDATLRDPALHSVIMELNGSGSRYGYDEAALVETMARYGFLPHAYDPFERTLTAAPGAGGWTGNALFVREAALMRERVARGRRVRVHGTVL